MTSACFPPCLLHRLSLCVSAECGNQQCELGEACASAAAIAEVTATGAANATAQCCPADCPIAVQVCATGSASGLACSGHGSCLTGVGVCQCFDGYTGDACDSCATQYVERPSTSGGGSSSSSSNGVSSCVFLPGSLSTCVNGVRDGGEAGVDCGGVCRTCTGTTVTAGDVASTVTHDDGKGAVVVEVVASLAAAAGLVAAVVAVRVRRGRAARATGSKAQQSTTAGRHSVSSVEVFGASHHPCSVAPTHGPPNAVTSAGGGCHSGGNSAVVCANPRVPACASPRVPACASPRVTACASPRVHACASPRVHVICGNAGVSAPGHSTARSSHGAGAHGAGSIGRRRSSTRVVPCLVNVLPAASATADDVGEEQGAT